MNEFRSITWIVAVATFLSFAAIGAAQNAPITIQVTQNGPPVGNVSIFTLASGNKFSPSTPPAGTTDTTGTFVFPSGLLSSNKAHTQMEVYEVCVNGKKVVFVIAKGSESQLPKDTADCKHRYIGGFYWDSGSTIAVDLGLGGGVTQNGGATAQPPSGNPLVSVLVGGGVGFKNFGGTSGDRAAFLQSFPGGTFSTPANSFAADVGGSIDIGHLVLGIDGWRANANDSKGSGPVLGGGTDTAVIAQQFQGFFLTAGGEFPLGRKASLIIRGGGNFWHANIDTKETVANGTTSSTVTNSRGVDGRGWTTGAALQVDISRRWSFVFRWDYIPMSNGPVNIHLNEGSVGVMFRLFGSPRK